MWEDAASHHYAGAARMKVYTQEQFIEILQNYIGELRDLGPGDPAPIEKWAYDLVEFCAENKNPEGTGI